MKKRRMLIAMMFALRLLIAAPSFAKSKTKAQKQAEKLKWLEEYWRESSTVVHSREIWVEFLRRNHLPDTRPHDADVIAAEKALLDELNTGNPKMVWASRARELQTAYVKERVRIAATLQPVIDPTNLKGRIEPCPPPATTNTGTTNTGTIKPRLIGSSKSAEDFWPIESKRLGEEGNVVTGLKISNTGCVIGKEIIISSGSDMLDRAALEFVETVEFVPAAIKDKAAESTTPFRIIFKLRAD